MTAASTSHASTSHIHRNLPTRHRVCLTMFATNIPTNRPPHPPPRLNAGEASVLSKVEELSHQLGVARAELAARERECARMGEQQAAAAEVGRRLSGT